MEDLIGFIFIWLFIEILFWGVAYSTGVLLIAVISFGKWKADHIKKKENRKVIKNQSGFELIERDGAIFLGAYGVALLGFCFWLVTLVAVVSYNIFT